MKTLIYTFVILTLIVNISFAQSDMSPRLLRAGDLRFNTENLFQAPFISDVNSQQSMQSIMQNSEKDIVFIENLGQIRDTKGNKRPDVLFLTRSQGVDMYITSSGITYVFRKTEGDIRESASMRKDKFEDTLPKSTGKQAKTSLYRLDMEFIGMNKDIKIKKELAVEQQFNYYTPEYPDGISPKAYKKITIENIYDGIDLVYYEKEGKMKYDFVVKAGADPNNIIMNYKGAGNVYIDKDGSVVITTPMGEIREEKPYTYSRITGLKIESSYKVKDSIVLFDIAEYNKSEYIIIDPYRIWATYYGGSNYEFGKSICTDNTGALYVTGQTESTNFPTLTLPGAYEQTFGGGGDDAFILKFNSNGERIWATYYGGNGYDRVGSICTDNLGVLYVTGRTHSPDFPTHILSVPGAYNQTSHGGGYWDAFILKFNSGGERLWATYYGGSGYDYGLSLCTDNSGALYVTGSTASFNFPLHDPGGGAYNQTYSGVGDDAFILKFYSNGTRIWSTYYGGSGYDTGDGICTDNSGALYVTGSTTSFNFPLHDLGGGAYYQTSHGGGFVDAFILKFNSGCARLWATYYGGNKSDEGWSICTDNSGNLYVTGEAGNNFPIQILPGAYNQTTTGGSYDAFILKFNNGCARLWATYYGGSSYDRGLSICTDYLDNIYVTGNTSSNNFPIKTAGIGTYNQTTIGGDVDAFILKFNNNSASVWATYYGGNSDDGGWSICTDNSGNVSVTGETKSANFPRKILTGAYNQTTIGGDVDAFILKFSRSFIPLPWPPYPLLPLYAAFNVKLNPKLVWYDSSNADSYRAQVSIDSSFSSTVYDSSNITITEFQIPNNGLSTNTRYYWRVNATNLAGTSRWSTVFYFTTGDMYVSGNNEIPKEFKLYNNYPNPFNPSTNIKFDIPKSSFVKMVIYNSLGKEIKTLVNEKLSTGGYEVDWNASGYTSGVYFYKLIADDFKDVKKMLLVK